MELPSTALLAACKDTLKDVFLTCNYISLYYKQYEMQHCLKLKQYKHWNVLQVCVYITCTSVNLTVLSPVAVVTHDCF